MDDVDGDIDVELLISLVQDRPVIWDKSLELYKSRAETSAAWRDVCSYLNPEFELLREGAKNKYGKVITTKWTNVRDRYTKYLKKLEEDKMSGAKVKPTKKYVYSDHMAFLQKNTMRKGTFEDKEHKINNPDGHRLTNKEDNETFFGHTSPTLGKRKRQKSSMTDIEKYILQKLQQPEDRHVSFFKGILPTLQKFNDDETLQFQGEVIKLIQSINRSRPVRGESNVPPSPHYHASQFCKVEHRNWGHTSSYEQSHWNPPSQHDTSRSPTPPIVSPAMSPSSQLSNSSSSTDHSELLD